MELLAQFRCAFNLLKPSVLFGSTNFNIQQILRSAHTVYLCVLCGSENKQPLFPYTALTDWFYNRDLTLYSPVVTICTASLTFNNSTFCPHTVFMCFVWIWEQTAIISLYNINWQVFITETQCVHCAVRTGFYMTAFNFSLQQLTSDLHNLKDSMSNSCNQFELADHLISLLDSQKPMPVWTQPTDTNTHAVSQ